MENINMDEELLSNIGKEHYLDIEKQSIVKRSTTIGRILRYLRKKVGFTQNEIASKIGIAQQTYAGYENGNHEPSIEISIRIANIYEISLDYLTGRYIGDGTDKAIETEIEMQEYLDNSIENNQILLKSEREYTRMVKEAIKNNKPIPAPRF